MSDRELIQYCRSHIETERGVIFGDMLNRMAALAHADSWVQLPDGMGVECGRGSANAETVELLVNTAAERNDIV